MNENVFESVVAPLKVKDTVSSVLLTYSTDPSAFLLTKGLSYLLGIPDKSVFNAN